MEKYIQLFEKLGIGEKISRVYLDLLEHGTSTIADITKRSWLHRVEVYRALPILRKKDWLLAFKNEKERSIDHFRRSDSTNSFVTLSEEIPQLWMTYYKNMTHSEKTSR